MDSEKIHTDASLLTRIKKDDEQAFKEIFNRYNKLLFNHVFNKLDNEGEARDIVQDIFIALWEKRAAIDDTNIAGYLFTAARNKTLNAIKHHKVVSRYEDDFKYFAGIFSTNNTENIIYKNELEVIIEAEIEALPSRMREVFILSRKQFLTHQEIADQLGISKHTVNDHIKASLKVLRTKLSIILLIIILSGH